MFTDTKVGDVVAIVKSSTPTFVKVTRVDQESIHVVDGYRRTLLFGRSDGRALSEANASLHLVTMDDQIVVDDMASRHFNRVLMPSLCFSPTRVDSQSTAMDALLRIRQMIDDEMATISDRGILIDYARTHA